MARKTKRAKLQLTTEQQLKLNQLSQLVPMRSALCAMRHAGNTLEEMMQEYTIHPLVVGINETDQGVMTYLRDYGKIHVILSLWKVLILHG